MSLRPALRRPSSHRRSRPCRSGRSWSSRSSAHPRRSGPACRPGPHGGAAGAHRCRRISLRHCHRYPPGEVETLWRTVTIRCPLPRLLAVPLGLTDALRKQRSVIAVVRHRSRQSPPSAWTSPRRWAGRWSTPTPCSSTAGWTSAPGLPRSSVAGYPPVLGIWEVTRRPAWRSTSGERAAVATSGPRPHPLVVGGSGLRAGVLGGWVRHRPGLRAELGRSWPAGPEKLHERLRRLDPAAAAAILPGNGRGSSGPEIA